MRLVLVGLLALCAPAVTHAQSGHVRTGDVVIRYWPGGERLAASLLPRDGMLRFVGLPDDVLRRGVDVTVYLAPDEARFDSLTGGRAPEWGAGVAFPLRGIIVLPGYVSQRTGTHTLPQILRHELAHVALQRQLGEALVPRWFTEGYATWTADQFDTGSGWQLRLALATDRAPPLDSLTLDWPLMVTDARLAYLLSASAVAYLHSLGTAATFERFLAAWAESADFERALRDVYVLASPQFERLWREHVKRRYGWVQVIAQTAFIWTVLTLLVLALFIIRRRRDRRRLQALRETELPDTPAWWLDPPPDQSGAGPGSPESGPDDGRS
jgi:hypothetical protein